ncbi:hypothetical protein ABVT39_021110 [Epinephelus coioides]
MEADSSHGMVDGMFDRMFDRMFDCMFDIMDVQINARYSKNALSSCFQLEGRGFVCMSRGDSRGTDEYKKELEKELQLMEDKGLWSLVGVKETDEYMEDQHLTAERLKDLQPEERYISGKVYLYKKSMI